MSTKLNLKHLSRVNHLNQHLISIDTLLDTKHGLSVEGTKGVSIALWSKEAREVLFQALRVERRTIVQQLQDFGVEVDDSLTNN